MDGVVPSLYPLFQENSRMSKPAATFFLIAAFAVHCRQLHADTIIQNQGMSTVPIANVDPVGQSFLWTTDPGLGSIGFTFSNVSPTSPNDPITVWLYAGAGFTGTVLGSVTQVLPADLPAQTLPGLPIDFDFSGILLAPGTYTAALTTTTSGFRVGLKVANNNPYADGAMFYTGILPPGLCTSSGANCDLQFRVTPASVPEATSIGTVVVGVMLVSALARSQKTSRSEQKARPNQ
jgi:hypothetical protein